MAQRIGIYPGTFDPVTYGHLDIIQRGLNVVDKLVVGIAVDNNKECVFSLKERQKMLVDEVAALGKAKAARVEVETFSGLLVKFAEKHDARLILRGMRVVSDFEYEFQMACMNNRLNKKMETLFLTASEQTQFVSSRFVKQICRLGGDISEFVPPTVGKRLSAYYRKSQRA